MLQVHLDQMANLDLGVRLVSKARKDHVVRQVQGESQGPQVNQVREGIAGRRVNLARPVSTNHTTQM